MTDDLNQLAKKFITGEWIYHANDKILKKTFASNSELSQLQLIDEEGYLNAGLKSSITQALGNDVLNNIVGPFGDNDIFSGDMLDDETMYNLELCDVSDATLEALEKIPGVMIKTV